MGFGVVGTKRKRRKNSCPIYLYVSISVYIFICVQLFITHHPVRVLRRGADEEEGGRGDGRLDGREGDARVGALLLC